MEQEVVAAIHATTKRNDAPDGVMQTADGAQFELFGGTMFALRELSPSICTVIVRAAAKTNAYIVPASDDGVALKVEGTTGSPPKGFPPVKVVADAQSLCFVLEHGYQSWRAFADHAHRALNPTVPR
jgi:hypothetical protein